MHSDYYGLRENAFQMTPDARLFFASSVHRRALAHLAYGIAQHEGFIIVTGEVGAGKTTLIERLCGDLDPAGFVVARIATTLVSGDDILRLVADAFGAPSDGSKAAVLRGITQALRGTRRRHLLIVDEAQGLPLDAIEELRMLSNLAQPGQPPLQTLLMGQPQLRRLLASDDLAQLRQRVLASFHLGCLTREETHGYVRHRLAAMGWVGRPAWDAAALDMVHRHSGGIPRRINRLCSRVMLAGALEGLEGFDAALVEATALELEEDLGGGPPPQGEAVRVPPAPPLDAPPPGIPVQAAERHVTVSAPLQASHDSAPAPGNYPSAPAPAHCPSAPARDVIMPAAKPASHLPPVAGPSSSASIIAMPAPRPCQPRPAPPARDWITSFFGARRRGGGR
jgi:type II secretory pathway predicted ATPase ExeA